VVGHQADHLLIDTLTAEITRTVQRMETGVRQVRCVADIVKPRRRDKIIRHCQLFGDPPSAPSHRPNMPPATRKRGRKLLLGKTCSVVDIDHDLDLTHARIEASTAPRRPASQSLVAEPTTHFNYWL
jgi:hypothetical protein